MQVTIKFGSLTKGYKDKSTITIGSAPNSDFVVDGLGESVLKMVYSSKYNNFVLVNSSNNKDILFNQKPFSKVLVTPNFILTIKHISTPIEVSILSGVVAGAQKEGDNMITNKIQPSMAKDAFDNDIEKHRIAIMKEIGFKVVDLKNTIKSASKLTLFLYIAVIVLSIVSSFGITNYLFGFKIDSSSSVLNLSTNPYILAGITLIVGAVSFAMKYGVYKYLDVNRNKRLGETDAIPKAIMTFSAVFMLVVYVLNLLYYKSIPGFFVTSLFISLLFVGALAAVTVAIGYLEFQMKVDKLNLTTCEYREDFEAVMKDYRKLIYTYVNKFSQNKINNIRNSLLNCQMKAVLETFIGILTSPFLAYGVSNTLASCFPEAAGWMRISGLRISPAFLVIATFLIIFAFFTFVRAFTLGKQIKGSEIIKFDGFHDYTRHGVMVLGLDTMNSLEKKKIEALFIACSIILIEFTMNVSYFITEIGGDIQGMFLSLVTALVPTALLIAETHMLSDTMYQIHNYEELLATLD